MLSDRAVGVEQSVCRRLTRFGHSYWAEPYCSFQLLYDDVNTLLSGSNVHDSGPSGSKELAHGFRAEGCSLSAKRGPKIPRSRVHSVAAIVWSQELPPLSPDGPSITSLGPDRIYRLLVTPWWTAGRNTKTTKPAIACGVRLSWCPRQDSNQRRPGFEGPHAGV